MKKAIVISLVVSLALNAVLALGWLYTVLMGCAEIPNGRIGVLSQDVRVGLFGESDVLFTLPKGLVVREASASGMDWFEPYRFRLVVTSDSQGLVDYPDNQGVSGKRTEYYSADVDRRPAEKPDGHDAQR